MVTIQVSVRLLVAVVVGLECLVLIFQTLRTTLGHGPLVPVSHIAKRSSNLTVSGSSNSNSDVSESKPMVEGASSRVLETFQYLSAQNSIKHRPQIGQGDENSNVLTSTNAFTSLEPADMGRANQDIHLNSSSGITLTKKVLRSGRPAHVFYVQDESRNRSANILKLLAKRPACHIPDNPMAKGQLCPCIPPRLKGKMLLDLNMAATYTWNETFVISQSGHLLAGGMWKPANCQARKSVLLIIPYRDREVHLKAFLAHMHPIMQRQQLDYRIVVVEQREPPIFNKAAMMNVAFAEARKNWLGKYDCVIFHDVDLIMEDDRNLLTCGIRPIHYGVFLDRHYYRKCCGMLFGGAFSMTMKQFVDVNGFSNNFFGWGGEDDNMFYRIRKAGFKKAIPSRLVGTYSTLRHLRDRSNPRNNKNTRMSFKKTPEEGLSTLDYSLVHVKELPLYTWILADLNVTGLPYPANTRSISIMFTSVSGDCPHQPNIASLPNASLNDCKKACSSNQECTAFVTPPGEGCHLKSGECENTFPSQGYFTYLKGVDLKLNSEKYKYEAYTADCPKHDLKAIRSKSPERCAKHCSGLQECRGFTFATGTCWLKKQCVPPVQSIHKVKTHTFVKKGL